MMCTVQTATSLNQILETSKSNPNKLHVLNFWSTSADACIHMNEVFAALASTHPSASFWDVDAESIADVTLHFYIESVPSFVFLKNGKELKRIVGAHPEELGSAVVELVEANEMTLEDRLKSLINKHHFMIFIKGKPKAPQCGFTRQLIELLNSMNIEYDYFDIFSDEAVRQALKTYSSWPTYPQIYIKGEFVGGLDILRELVESNQLFDLIKQ